MIETEFKSAYDYLDQKMSEPREKWDVGIWERELDIFIKETIEKKIPRQEEFFVKEIADILNAKIPAIRTIIKRKEVKTKKRGKRIIISQNEVVKIINQRLSYLSFSDTSFLLRKYGLYISERNFYYNFWKKYNPIALISPGRGGSNAYIHYSNFIAIVKELKKGKERKESDDYTTVTAAIEQAKVSRATFMETLDKTGVEIISQPASFQPGFKKVSSLLKRDKAQEIIELFTEFSSRTEYTQTMKDKSLLQEGKKLIYLTDRERISPIKLLREHNLLIETHRGKLVNNKKLNALIDELLPLRKVLFREKRETFHIWVKSQQYIVPDDLPSKLDDLSYENELALWLLVIQGNQKIFEYLRELYKQDIWTKARQLYWRIPVKTKVSWGQEGLWRAIYNLTDLDKIQESPGYVRARALSFIWYEILSQGSKDCFKAPGGGTFLNLREELVGKPTIYDLGEV